MVGAKRKLRRIGAGSSGRCRRGGGAQCRTARCGVPAQCRASQSCRRCSSCRPTLSPSSWRLINSSTSMHSSLCSARCAASTGLPSSRKACSSLTMDCSRPLSSWVRHSPTTSRELFSCRWALRVSANSLSQQRWASMTAMPFRSWDFQGVNPVIACPFFKHPVWMRRCARGLVGQIRDARHGNNRLLQAGDERVSTPQAAQFVRLDDADSAAFFQRQTPERASQ